MAKIKKIFQNDYVFSMLNKVLSVILGLFTTALITRFLGPELRGQYVVYLNVINMSAIILGLGFYQSYPNANKIQMKNANTIYLNLFFLQFVLYLILAILISILTKSRVLGLTILTVPTQIYMQQLGMIGLIDCIRYRQKLQMAFYFIDFFMTVIIFVGFEAHVIIPIAIIIIKNAFFIIAYLIKMRYIPSLSKMQFPKGFFKYLFRTSIFAMFFVLLSNLNYKADIFCLDYLVTDTQVGIYSVGIALAEYIYIIPDAFHEVIFSKTAKDNAIEDIIFSIKINIFISIVIIISMLFLGKYLILLMYGKEFVSAYKVTNIIFLGIPSMIIFKLIQPLYTSNGKNFFCFIVLLISVIANIGMNFILVPLFGIEGAGAASVISYSICGIVFLIDFIRRYSVKWYEPLILSRNDIKKIQSLIKQK